MIKIIINLFFAYILGEILTYLILTYFVDGCIIDRKTGEKFFVGSKEYQDWSISASLFWPKAMFDILKNKYGGNN